MKKSIVILYVVLLAFVMVGAASAISLELTYTADNKVVNVWYQRGSAPLVLIPLGSGAANWGLADTSTLNLDIGAEYKIIWQLENYSWEGTPGGFLAELTLSTPFFVNNLLSSTEWEVAFVEGSLDVPDWSTLVWSAATEYAANNEPGTIWYKAAWGPISDIAGEAEWIWTDLNFTDPGAPGTGDSVFIRATVDPVPEPVIITVTSPNDGEEFPAGETYAITWTSAGDIANVKIEYSINDGAEWSEIADNTENNGSYLWEAPCDLSDESLIMISDVDSDVTDESDEVFSIIDDIAPDIEVSATPDILWPPNHKMVHVTATVSATDNCDPNPTIELVSVIMNESDETITFDPNYDFSVNDGQTSGDIQIVDDFNFYLRCERSGKSDGRTYTITYSATDASGNKSTASTEVLVPHSM